MPDRAARTDRHTEARADLTGNPFGPVQASRATTASTAAVGRSGAAAAGASTAVIAHGEGNHALRDGEDVGKGRAVLTDLQGDIV
ncbi:MAG TPA: hypothetical protein VHG92_06785 [Afifellaceae bacterium]|nr:hypothetical protein [Afifellaceae bacterium]